LEICNICAILKDMKILITIVSLLFTLNASAELFKWVDQDGVIHYSDKRPADTAQQQELSGHLARLRKKKEEAKEDNQNIYEEFSVTQPQKDSVVRDADSNVDIVIQINPPLTEKHFLQIYLDGLEVGEKTKFTNLTLKEVKKGIHRLQGKIIDENAQVISTTEEVTFQFRKPADLSKIAPNLVPPAK
jgi:hypothetical protein